MSSLIWAAQVAAVARWRADAGVGALIGDRIYDGLAPQGAQLPYVVVGQSTETVLPTMGTAGGNATLTCAVVSEYDGLKEAMAVVAALSAALAAALTLTGFGAAKLRQEFVETFVDRDTEGPPLRRVPVRYRIVSF